MMYASLLGGLLLLLLGGDSLVRGAVSIAQRLRMSPLLIGLTLVGFGTSTPELLTSLQATFAGSPGIAVGNVVGSNTANILLILGVAAVICPMATSRSAFTRDGTVLLVSALACLGVVLVGSLDRLSGLALVGLLIAYLTFTYLRERTVSDASSAMHAGEASAAEPRPQSLWLAIVFAVGGLALILLGAQFLVQGAIAVGRTFGVSETVLGLTVVAVGTSLPELVTSVVAAIRRQSDVAFGNVIGSNIFNSLGILGVTAAVHPIPVPPQIAAMDIWVMLGATLLLIVFAVTGWRLSRIEGGVFLALYGGYIVWLGTGLMAAPL
ncbi:calcium/sodium antiporter [Rhodospira trueperi]|uniref:Cation:H+ antiporter n=1 Tax=Rhodospira trueperi TaxID=69960 RepID=A0A1G7APR2_9PROT|nr:calcium/sodium antiporter [Rhodospira trueperi]SDE16791.1 cation:H+ antiporter [Rhodospira trueperi]